MRRLLLAAVFAILPLAPAIADETPASKLTLEAYQALPEAERTAYIAGLADALDVAAAMGKSERLKIIAACTHGFPAAALREAVEAGPPDMAFKWAADAPAANWFVQTMILVCQLQLQPE